MITPVQLQSGLSGAIGGAYDQAHNRLYFTEFAGQLSRLDLTPSSATIIASASSATLQGTYSFNFDTGIQINDAGADVWWQQMTTTERQLVPHNGAQFHYLGSVSYSGLSAAELAALPYSSDPIAANVGAGNLLYDGAVFAIRTTAGHYTKVQITNYDYNLQFRFRTYRIPTAYQVIGTGYNQPEDIALSSDGQHAYVTERNGNFLRVDLADADRGRAQQLVSGLTAPHQIAMDELHGYAYTVEFATSGRLLQIDLNSGTLTTLATDLDHAIGLAMTGDGAYAYVSEQSGSGGRIRRIELASGNKETIRTGLTAPFFLRWTDPGESGLLFTERAPANRVMRLDLSDGSFATQLISNVPHLPSCAVVINPFRLLVCSDQVISQLDLDQSVYTATGPILLGIGHVPFDRIFDGYADTTGDPGYFFQVKDAPFGGTLPIMLNHRRAYDNGARYYKLSVDGSEPRQSFNDYKWSTSGNRFNLTTTNPSSGGYYRLRRPNELWYHPWLGYRLQTGALSNGLHTITVQLFGSASAASAMGSYTIDVRIDNTLPEAAIEQVVHLLPGGGQEIVGTCGIVTTETDQFRFRITARDNEGHLRNWNLRAFWGDNQSAAIDSDSYSPVPSRQWTGPASQLVPAAAWAATVPGDPTSRRCAHTFRLTVWDRVIDGYRHIHRESYQKSITLLLP